MGLEIAILLTVIGLIYYFHLTLRVRSAWKKVAKELSLEFHNSFWLPNIKVQGTYQGFDITLKYTPRDESSWVSGSYTERRKRNTRYWTRLIVKPVNHTLPLEIYEAHPQNDQYRAIHGTIQYPTDYGPYHLSFTTFHAWKYKHFPSARKIISHLKFMMNWASELQGR